MALTTEDLKSIEGLLVGFATKDDLTAQIDRLDMKIDGLDAKIDGVKSELIGKIEALDTHLSYKIDRLDARVRFVSDLVQRDTFERLDDYGKRITRLEAKESR